jgi:DNA processing protein
MVVQKRTRKRSFLIRLRKNQLQSTMLVLLRIAKLGVDILNTLLYLLWLTRVEGVGPVRQKELLRHFSSPLAVYNATRNRLREIAFLTEPKLSDTNIENILAARDLQPMENILAEAKKKNIQIITLNDDAYPSLLKEISDPPLILYVMGQLPDDDDPKVSIIGSRRCSEYGLTVARKLSEGLAGHHVTVVSGMARGIDSMAHKGALDAGGQTVAVLGCGTDICYPTENWGLRNRILTGGCVLSEYPPTTPPMQSFFPARNRIISGLSAVTVVVEAAKQSGTLITVSQALDQGRDVMAVPGNVTSKLSEGVNELIKDGAGVVTDYEDILRLLHIPMLHIPKRKVPETGSVRQPELAPDEKLVYDSIKFQPIYLDEISDKIDLEMQTIHYILTMLELKGCIEKLPGQRYIRL